MFNDDLMQDIGAVERKDSWLPDIQRASTLNKKLIGYKNESERITK